MFNIARIASRSEAHKHGEEKGTKMGIIIALFLVFIWFFDLSPFGISTTFIFAALSIVCMRYYGGEMLGKRFDYYERERTYLRAQNVIADPSQIFDIVAKMHGK